MIWLLECLHGGRRELSVEVDLCLVVLETAFDILNRGLGREYRGSYGILRGQVFSSRRDTALMGRRPHYKGLVEGGKGRGEAGRETDEEEEEDLVGAEVSYLK